jgi:hypothetical protein
LLRECTWRKGKLAGKKCGRRDATGGGPHYGKNTSIGGEKMVGMTGFEPATP